MKAPIFIRPLTDDERNSIEKALRSPSAFVLRRGPILLASARREHASAIARHLGCDEGTVRNVIRGFNQRGLAVLGKQSCRPHRLRTSIPKATLEQLRDLLHRSPREFGIDQDLWSLPVAAKIAFLQGVTTVPTTGSSIRRALSRLGGSPEAGQALDHPSRSPIRAKKTVRAEVASD
jgi:transposase